MDELNGSSVHFALTGDNEIDAFCPSYPRLMPELSLVQVDANRLILLGGLSAPILPQRAGSLHVVDFLERLDGHRNIAALCAPEENGHEEKKKLLFTLLRLGVLEQGAGPHATAPGITADSAAFLAKVMDQTRLHNQRAAAGAALTRTIGLLGCGPFCKALGAKLVEMGMRVESAEQWATQQDGVCPYALVIAINDVHFIHDHLLGALQHEQVPVLLVTPYAEALDIGPLLLSRGTCTIACYRREQAGLPLAPACADDANALWLAIVSNVVVLMASNTSALPLVNNFFRYENHPSGLRTMRHPVARSHHLQDTSALLSGLPSGAAPQRLQRHSRMATPPRRIVGAKSHDVHYSAKNVAAAREFPVPHGRAVIHAANANPEQQYLLQLVERGFGYWEDSNGNLKRICPSGGNLGAAECLVIWTQPNAKILLRYVPLHRHLEMVVPIPMPAAGVESCPQYEILCVSNIEKATRKYYDFGLSLAFIDSGVASAFTLATAHVLGLPLQVEYTRPDDWQIESILQHRAHYYAFAWRAALPKAVPTGEACNLVAFDKLLAQRSAARGCLGLDLQAKSIQALLSATRPAAYDDRTRALLELLSPVLCLHGNGPSEVYILRHRPQLEWEPLAGSSLARGAARQELLSQHNLNQASAMLFLLADLPTVLQLFGDAGHDQLLTLCGQWVGAFWLEIEKEKHRGCPAGGSVEADLLANLPPHMSHLFNLFSFTFGKDTVAR
jgi:hypothetical protein